MNIIAQLSCYIVRLDLKKLTTCHKLKFANTYIFEI